MVKKKRKVRVSFGTLVVASLTLILDLLRERMSHAGSPDRLFSLTQAAGDSSKTIQYLYTHTVHLDHILVVQMVTACPSLAFLITLPLCSALFPLVRGY